MYALRFMGTLAIIPTTLLLTVSFFVLFALRKIETNGLKTFGYAIVVLLWISSALVLSAGIYSISTGHHPLMSLMHGAKGQMPCIMEKQGMMSEPEEKQEMPPKSGARQGMMQRGGMLKGQTK